MVLTPEELRVVGVLMEKEVTTPDYYPMTLNAIVNGCNQKNCRAPLTAYDEALVAGALDRLRYEKLLISLVSGAESRVPKYRQRLTEQLVLTLPAHAVMAELILRGTQTVGELRSRAERMCAFSSLDEIQQVLKTLTDRPDGPLVMLLPRVAGHKENRWMHLLGGTSESAENSPAPVASRSLQDQIQRHDIEIAALRAEVEQLKSFMAEFQTPHRASS
ncbi:MAG: YceH family protein [bacterium]